MRALQPPQQHEPEDFKGTGVCKPDCDYDAGEFCGNDDVCHAFNCRDWYDFGPRIYTGRDPHQSHLSCSEDTVPPTLPEWGVVFGCLGYSHTTPPRGEAVVQGYTERCQAENSNTTFVCYGMKPDTDFSIFLRNVELNRVVCENSSATPKFIYQIHLHALHHAIFWGPQSTASFNETRAQRTLWMKLSSDKYGTSASPSLVKYGWLMALLVGWLVMIVA